MQLTKEEGDVLRQKLENELNELKAQITKMVDLAHVQRDSRPVGELAKVSAIRGQQFPQLVRQRTQEEINLKVAALERMKNNTYGICSRCHKPIGFERLTLRPEAILCLHCSGI